MAKSLHYRQIIANKSATSPRPHLPPPLPPRIGQREQSGDTEYIFCVYAFDNSRKVKQAADLFRSEKLILETLRLNSAPFSHGRCPPLEARASLFACLPVNYRRLS